jgi:hypothetical protein
LLWLFRDREGKEEGERKRGRKGERELGRGADMNREGRGR